MAFLSSSNFSRPEVTISCQFEKPIARASVRKQPNQTVQGVLYRTIPTISTTCTVGTLYLQAAINQTSGPVRRTIRRAMNLRFVAAYDILQIIVTVAFDATTVVVKDE